MNVIANISKQFAEALMDVFSRFGKTSADVEAQLIAAVEPGASEAFDVIRRGMAFSEALESGTATSETTMLPDYPALREGWTITANQVLRGSPARIREIIRENRDPRIIAAIKALALGSTREAAAARYVAWLVLWVSTFEGTGSSSPPEDEVRSPARLLRADRELRAWLARRTRVRADQLPLAVARYLRGATFQMIAREMRARYGGGPIATPAVVVDADADRTDVPGGND